MRHRTHYARIVVLLPALALLMGLVGGCSSTAPAAKTTATVTPTAPTATQSAGVPTPQPPPYSFPYAWSPNGPVPGDVGGFAFSRVDPRTGYTCLSVPSQPAGYPLPAADRLSGPAPVYVTHDGGATWAPLGAPEPGSSPTGGCLIAAGDASASDILLYGSAGLAHSRDGGATWSPIPLPTVPNAPPTFVAFVGDYTTSTSTSTRIVISLGISGEGQLPDPNYATDDGGKTWKPIGADFTAGGKSLQPGLALWMNGGDLIIPASTGAGGLYPRGSQTPATYYFRSHDGGATWAPFVTPDASADQLTLGLAANGHTVYAFCATIAKQNGVAVRVPYFSADGGAQWRQLPTLAGVENGYPDPGLFEMSQMAVLPDGSLVAGTLHDLANGGIGDAGYFRLRTADATPSWQPLASAWNINLPYGVSHSGGVRLWALHANGQGSGSLLSIDLT